MKKIVSFLLFVVSVCAHGQSPYAHILQQIEQNSTTLLSYRSAQQAEAIGNKTGLLPNDPDISLSNKWKHPTAPTTTKEIGVSQAFDFPTVYSQRNRLSKMQTEASETAYEQQRMTLLLEAEKLCIQITYCNAMDRLYSVRTDYAKRIAEAQERMLQNGESNQLDRNKAALNHSNLQNEMNRIYIERDQLLSDLKMMNGGNDIHCDVEHFTIEAIPTDFDAWYASAEAAYPELRLLRSQEKIAERRVKLTKAENLPKWSVGYSGEFVGTERTQGIHVGLSIPLWQNKNRVKHAKALTTAAQQATNDASLQHRHRMKSLHTEICRLQQTVSSYRDALKSNDNVELLRKAYEQGEISLLDYLLELEYIYACHRNLIEAERDLALSMAEFTAHEL